MREIHQSRAVSQSVGRFEPPRSVGSIPRAIHRDLARTSRDRRRGTIVERCRRNRTGINSIPQTSSLERRPRRRSTRVIARRERIDPRADVIIAPSVGWMGTRRRARCETYLGGGLGGERGGENGRHGLRCGRAGVRVCGGGRDAVERRGHPSRDARETREVARGGVYHRVDGIDRA